VAGDDLPVAEKIKVLEGVLDWRLIFHKLVSAVARSCNYYTQAIRHLLTMELAQTLACSRKWCGLAQLRVTQGHWK